MTDEKGPVTGSGLADEFRLQIHPADTRDFARKIMSVMRIDKADSLDLGAALDDRGRPFDLQILDNGYAIAICKYVPIGITHDGFILSGRGPFGDAPFERAFRAHPQSAILINMFTATLRADIVFHDFLVLFSMGANLVRIRSAVLNSIQFSRVYSQITGLFQTWR